MAFAPVFELLPAMSTPQVQLLSSAVQALREGGRVVYSTCSINVTENDQVRCPCLEYMFDVI